MKTFQKINLLLLVFKLVKLQNYTELKDSDILKFIESSPFTFLKVYSKNCGHCQAAETPFNNVSKRIKNPKLKIGNIDGEKYPDVMKLLDIQGYPGIFMFFGGLKNRLQYFGPVSDEQHFYDFVIGILNKDQTHFYDENQIETTKKSNEYIGFGVFCGKEDSSQFQKIKNASLALHDFPLYITNVDKTCRMYSISSNQLAFKRISGSLAVIKTIEKLEDLKTQLRFIKYDYINPFKQEFFYDAIGDSIPFLIYASKNENKEHLKALENYYQMFPKNRIINLYNEFKTEFEREYFSVFDIDDSQLPVLFIAEIKQNVVKYLYSGKLTPESITNFVKNYFDKKLKKNLKSQKVVNDEVNTKSLTANTIVDFLSDSKVFKLILFYSPGCLGCGNIETVFRELANEFGNDKRVKFGKIDVNQNEVPSIKKVPAISFFKKDFSDNPEFYKGSGEVKLLKKFVEKKLDVFGDDEL